MSVFVTEGEKNLEQFVPERVEVNKSDTNEPPFSETEVIWEAVQAKWKPEEQQKRWSGRIHWSGSYLTCASWILHRSRILFLLPKLFGSVLEGK